MYDNPKLLDLALAELFIYVYCDAGNSVKLYTFFRKFSSRIALKFDPPLFPSTLTIFPVAAGKDKPFYSMMLPIVSSTQSIA